MQYKIKTAGLLLAMSLAFSLSCNKDNIDVDPLNLTEESYFSKEIEFSKAVFGIYARMTDWYNFNGGNILMPIIFLPGDDITTSGSNPFEHFGSLQASEGRIGMYFDRSYQIVSRANIVLEKIEAENGVYTTPDLKNYHKGEALFLRGLAFFHLYNLYGKAPIVIKRINTMEEWSTPESSGTQMLDQAIADFTEAASLLPASWSANNVGRATKNASYGMLGKSLVFRGSINGTQADYTAGIQAFDQISGVMLVPDFSDNTSVNAENNAESLFEFQASQPDFDNVWLPNEFDGSIGTISSYWGYYYTGNVASNNNINFIGTTKLLNAFDAGDPRREATLDPATRAIQKYVSDDAFSQSGVGSVNNVRILRFADVLLLKAEAVLQSGGSTSDAVELINQVRTRARNMSGGTFPANYPAAETNKTTIMNWIMKERLLELAAEGQRWFDLRRWHLAGYITLNNQFFDPENESAMNFDVNKNLVMPIPQSEVDKNPNITQNPGY